MAMTADSATNHHSPRGSGHTSGAGDGQSSPQLRRKNLPSPWAQVVRGGEPESVFSQRSPSSSPPPPVPPTSVPEPAVPESSSPSKAASSSPPPPPVDNSSSSVMAAVAVDTSDASNSNAARPKKPAWNKPSNGVVEVGPVMGAVSWPALSESTKPSPKPSSSSLPSLAEATSSSPKTVSEGSVTNNQVPVIANVPQKQTTSTGNANPSSSSNPNRSMAGRPKSKRGGSGNNGGGMNNVAAGSGQGGFNRPTPATQSATPPPPPPPPFPLFSVPPPTFGSIIPPPLPDPSPREPMYRGNNWETRPVGGFVSQSHPSNEHRNNSRRGNYGPRGGDSGPYHNNFGNRRDQEHGNYGNSRDVHVQSPRGPPRGFVRPPPPNAATFVPPQTMRQYPNAPIGFPEFFYHLPQMPMEPFRGIPGVPYIPPPGPPASVFVPASEPALAAMLVNQIDYYFSDANLVKDEFLKSNMDDQGWVPISLIAGFPRVKNLTTNVQLILDSLRTSTVVEVQDENVRRRSEWLKWVPAASRAASDSGLPSPGSDSLTTSIQKITMVEGAFDKGTKAYPHTEDSPSQQLPNGEAVDDKHTNEN